MAMKIESRQFRHMLPVELLHVIASHSVEAYRVLLAVPVFARSIDTSARYDYMIMFGYGIVITRGFIQWTKNGQPHRTDGPAVEYSDGARYWFVNGKRHRTDGPAVELADGSRKWYVDGKRHRTDGPAIEYPDGVCYWYIDGKHIGWVRESKMRTEGMDSTSMENVVGTS